MNELFARVMHIRPCLTIYEASSWQPLGWVIDFKEGWDINHCPMVIACLCVWRRPSISARRRLIALPLPPCIHCSYLTPCYTPNAKPGNAYLKLAGPNLQICYIIWVCWSWIGSVGCFSGLDIGSLAVFVNLYWGGWNVGWLTSG